jgi:hypothetical protein
MFPFKKPLSVSLFIYFILIAPPVIPLKANGVRFPNPEFLQKFHPLDLVPFYGWPDSTAELGPFRQYDLVRDSKKGWLLLGDGSGQVWMLNRDSIWVRQDSTDCIGYNFSSFLMPGPMKFGGDGIWRSNGLLIQYLWDSYEWETIQLSREIPMYHRENCYLSSEDSALILLGAEYSNQGIKNYYTTSDSVYRLDLRNGSWNVLGKITERLHYHLGESIIISAGIRTPDGVLFRSAKERKLIALDFKSGQATLIGGDSWVKLWEMGTTNYSKEKVIVTDSIGIHSMNPKTYELSATLTWKELFVNAESVFPIYESNGSASFNPWWLTLLILPLTGFMFVRYRKRALSNTKSINSEADTSTQSSAARFKLTFSDEEFEVNGITLIGMTSKERQLIKALVERRSGNEPLYTQEFNELLDIGQRSLDNQKKIRSEVVRSVNRIFNAAGFQGEAIVRSRQEDDRRAIAYELSAHLEV